MCAKLDKRSLHLTMKFPLADPNDAEAKTLHELSSKNFDRSPDGSIFTNELKTVFSIMILCLKLEDKCSLANGFPFSLNKKIYAFGFSIDEAIEVLKDLHLDIKMNSTSVHISYAMKAELGLQLLNTFMEAKLLHTPADKTRSHPKDRICLQPTPKGVAVVCNYAKKMAIKELPPILKSDFNSMRLFEFERNPSDDSIIHSEYFISLLFAKIMGPRPNIWSPKNSFDRLPKLSKLLEPRNYEAFTFESIRLNDVKDDINSVTGIHDLSESKSSLQSTAIDEEEEMENENRTSPFAHRYFSNPDSDAHIQYYVSDFGIRLFQEKFVDEIGRKVDSCFSTKALWQWLMECSDIMYPKEAVFVASLFLKYGLIIPVHPPSRSKCRRKFIISKKSVFTLTNSGWDTIRWIPDDVYKRKFSEENSTSLNSSSSFKQSFDKSTSHLNSVVSFQSVCDTKAEGNFISAIEALSLKEVLADPGIRYLFRAHLSKDLCAENLDVYVDITKFMRKMSVLKKLMDSRDCSDQMQQEALKWQSSKNSKLKETLRTALLKQTNECLSLAYNIYSSYIASGSPHQLNIDHKVREQVTKVIIHPHSPLTTKFGSQIECLESTCNSELPLAEKKTTGVSSTEKLSSKIYCERQFGVDKFANVDNSFASSLNPNVSTEDFSDCPSMMRTTSMLHELYILFETIRDKTYVMMKNDSLPKFLASDEYKEATALLAVNK